MVSYEELKKNIEDLENICFDYHKETICYKEIYITTLLRRALIYNNNIYRLKNKDSGTELQNKLNSILRNKFKQLNPNFSDSVIDSMINCCYRGNFQYPVDIFVVDDGVFTKEATYDDFGSLYKINTFMYDSSGTYFHIYNWLSFRGDFNFNDFFEEKKFRLTNEENMNLSRFISENINHTLYDEYQRIVTRPLYELNNDKAFYGYDGLIESDVRNVNIYFNKTFREIAKHIRNRCECDIRMFVQDKDNISLYNFHQSFIDNEPVWNVQKLDAPIWKLSEEALKFESKTSGIQKKLKK